MEANKRTKLMGMRRFLGFYLSVVIISHGLWHFYFRDPKQALSLPMIALDLALLLFVVWIIITVSLRPIQHLHDQIAGLLHKQPDVSPSLADPDLQGIALLATNLSEKLQGATNFSKECGDELRQSAFQIGKIVKEISSVSNFEEKRASEVASVSRQLCALSSEVQSSAASASSFAETMRGNAASGIDCINFSIASMRHTSAEINRASSEIADLGDAAKSINAIIETINTISEQTNLLALNAAIEAARAGDQGRGFAVVADEVRGLAKNTGESVKKISGIIQTLTTKVAQVTETMTAVVSQFSGNADKVQAVAAMISNISTEAQKNVSVNQTILAASQSQLDQSQSLNSNLDELIAVLKDSAAKVHSTAFITETLLKVTDKLTKSDEELKTTFLPVSKTMEKRRNPRATKDLYVKVRKGQHRIEGISRDISISGLQLCLSEPLENKRATLDIYLPFERLEDYDKQTPLHLEGVVKWDKLAATGEARFLYGIRFENTNADQSRKIQDCLEFFKRLDE